MQISGSGHVHGAQGLRGPHASRPSSPASPAARTQAVDQLDISPEAARAADAGAARSDRVAQIKSQIQSGAYETQGKIDAALDRLLDEIG